MAARPQHVRDSGVVERRVRPIYEWLDIGNNKKALQEAEKVLKKSPALQCARALKGLSLLRLGRVQEANPILETLTAEKPTDDPTLQVLTICYREPNQLWKVCALYESAVKQEPNNEELHTHLFMTYVRVGDFKAQQQAAMALYKLAPKNPYYFWAVMSIVLQAKGTDDTIKKGVLLSLAQRMVDKLITENKLEAEQEARLYIMILHLLKKFDVILKFMEGPLYSKLSPGNMPQSSIPYLVELGHWKQLNGLCKELLTESPDRWDYYVPYFKSSFEMIKCTGDVNSHNDDSENVKEYDDTAEKCCTFISKLVSSLAESKNVRGPYIARLELYKRLLEEQQDVNSLMGSAVKLFTDYWDAFGHKSCCVRDMEPFLLMLPEAERQSLCRDFLSHAGLDYSVYASNANDIQRQLSCVCIARLCGCEVPVTADRLRDHYMQISPQLPSFATELGPTDSYAVLAAHLYYDIALQEKSSKPMVEALCVLKLLLKRSPSNFHAKLLCLKLYHLLGCGTAAQEVYETLDAKHIQLDTLAWLHTVRLVPTAVHARAIDSCDAALRFYTHHEKDGIEHLTVSYKFGTFEKLCELMSFRSRLSASAQGALVRAERALLELTTTESLDLAAARTMLEESGNLDRLTDNRDLDVVVCWDPYQRRNSNIKEHSFKLDQHYIKFKTSLLRSLVSCADLLEAHRSQDEKEKRTKVGELAEAVAELVAMFDGVEADLNGLSGDMPDSISAPYESRLIGIITSSIPYVSQYKAVFAAVVEAVQGNGEDGKTKVRRSELVRADEELTAARHVLEKQLQAQKEATDPLWTNRRTLEMLSNFVEFVSVISYVFGMYLELLGPVQNKKTKKKNAVNMQTSLEGKVAPFVSKFYRNLVELVKTIHSQLERWPELKYNIDIEENFSKLSLDEAYHYTVINKLKESHEKSVTSIRDILKRKMKYLNSINC